MNRRKVKNVAASIRQRLLNEARTTGRPFNELLQYFAMERFLYRLSKSPHGEKFVLKGALMLATWEVSLTRPTKDIDLLRRVSNDIDSIVGLVKEVCRLEVQPDGLVFDSTSVQGEQIAEEAEYEGVRVRFQGNLGTARVSMQIDVGFGDAVVPGAGDDGLSDDPGPADATDSRVHGRERHRREVHTMVRRGLLNSRMRDFFDVWTLSRQFDFDGGVLAAAVRETFARRDLEVAARPVALTKEFAEDTAKASQWQGFLRKSRLEGAPSELVAVVEAIAVFLGPVAEALHEGRGFEGRWEAPGPWSNA